MAEFRGSPNLNVDSMGAADQGGREWSYAEVRSRECHLHSSGTFSQTRAGVSGVSRPPS